MSGQAEATGLLSAETLAELDSSSFVPLYAQLADRLAELIRRDWPRAIGKTLPSEAECMRLFGVSRPTVRQAMAHLRSQGLITRAKGRGTFVAPLALRHDVTHGFENDIRAMGKKVRYEGVSWKRIALTPELAQVFGHAAHECYTLKRLRSVDGEIVGLEERYLPYSLGRHVTRTEIKTRSALDIVRRISQEGPTRLKMEVSSAAATRDLAALLGVKAGAPLLVRVSTFFTDREQPLMHGTAIFLAQHYKLRFSMNFTG